ncbi:hypothetical protein LIER_31539 [Lithospermum erythrorhizon]|uniref:Uncharacterized protein n=1 Tax=Lithospermum erythrorhizon TaxID=34254 RepID=A0AAV3RR98_LITER
MMVRKRRSRRKENTGSMLIWQPADDQVGSDDEDVEAVMSRRRKAKGKLKMNENRTRVENKRIPKNVAEVPMENVVVKTDAEKEKWNFVATPRITAERMLSEVTKNIADIMGILEYVGIMPTIDALGPHYPKIVREFIYNMIDDVNDTESINFQKSPVHDRHKGLFNFGQFTFDQTVQYAQSHVILNPIAYPGLLCNIMEDHHPDILTTMDEEALSPGFLTVSPKLLQGTHVTNIPLRPCKIGGSFGVGQDETIRIIRDEMGFLGVIAEVAKELL